MGRFITGIGFIGAGVIIMGKKNIVTGVTSAAIIRVLAAIGAAIGLGLLTTGIARTLMAVGVLVGVALLESTFLKLRQGFIQTTITLIDPAASRRLVRAYKHCRQENQDIC